MRILHTLHSTNPAGGGVVEAIYQLARGHALLGHTIDIASLDAPSALWLKDSPFAVHPLGPGLFSYGFAPKFVSWLHARRGDYDVVVVNGIWQFSSYGVHQIARRTSLPYVVFPHGMLDPWFKRTYPLKHWKKCMYWRWGEYRVLRDARFVMFTSEEERRHARQSFRPYSCREVIANLGTADPGGNSEQQRELFLLKWPKLSKKRVLLFLGRVHPKKGCELLISAFAQARAAFAKQNEIHLVIAGPCANTTYLKSLQRLAYECFPGEEPPVTWTGMLAGDLKWGAFHVADAFVLPSHQENFGFAVVEALSVGVPVLVSDKVNIWREIVEDNAGWVANDDAAGTRQLLKQWLEASRQVRMDMRTAARKCFLSRFESSRAANRSMELLEKAVACEPSRSLSLS